MKTHSAIAVADYILHKASETNNPLTPMQVLKLVYICHGWMYGINHRPLITESVEAWQYGPVIPELYTSIKKFRSNPVEYPISSESFDQFDIDTKELMDEVVAVYGEFSGPKLSRITHEKGTPWFETWKHRGKYCVISNDLIEDYYAELATQE